MSRWLLSYLHRNEKKKIKRNIVKKKKECSFYSQALKESQNGTTRQHNANEFKLKEKAKELESQ